ncbi:MAG: hypothetical protein J0L92_10510 [Deltaproteobacteria bacterium]|nr:hypothetical protein [Deltaproteobacteria bacterium]
MLTRILHVLLALAAVAGFLFSAVSTSDFTAHLDRQVHGIHCSFVPGADTPDVSGSSGCHATLMSPYSSVMRDTVWGGIPVSLPSMAVFAYLLVCALAILVLRKPDDPRATGYQWLAWTLPFLTSCVFGYLSLHELDAACKLCIGIYTASTVGFLLAGVTFFAARVAASSRITLGDDLDDLGSAETALDERVVDARTARALPEAETQLERSEIAADQTIDETSKADIELDEPPRRKVRLATASEMDRRIRSVNAGNRRRREESPTSAPDAPTGFGVLALAFVAGLAFVIVPVVAYAAQAPDFERFVGACGTLAHPEDEGHVLVPLGSQTREVTMLEVLDPLCPSCRGFERRFSQHPAAEQVSRRVLLFPLDAECNRMLTTSLHPGACAISEAVLCAEEDADEVLAWAFDHQEEIREAETASAGAARRMASERFPSLRSCIGSANVRAELNRSLRWAVANQLPVLTPQVYVNETRICDEDTDLGLDYVLTRLTSRAGGAR